MFNKKSFIGILVIVLTMMLIVGCSEIAPNISLELERKKPDSMPQQALDNQQATANVPDHAQANLPFSTVVPDWAKEIEIRHYYDGNSSDYYVYVPGSIVQPEINSNSSSEIYVLNITDNILGVDEAYTVYFTRYIDGIVYEPNPDTLSYDFMTVFDYPNYGIDELTGYTLHSIEPIEIEGYDHVWKINFVPPEPPV